MTRRYEARSADYEREFCLLAEQAVQSHNWKGEVYDRANMRPIFEHQLPDHLKPAVETCRAIHGWFRDAASFDLHHENILWDDDLPIINDPISFKSARAMQQEVQHDSTDPYPARLDMERAAQRIHPRQAAFNSAFAARHLHEPKFLRPEDFQLNTAAPVTRSVPVCREVPPLSGQRVLPTLWVCDLRATVSGPSETIGSF